MARRRGSVLAIVVAAVLFGIPAASVLADDRRGVAYATSDLVAAYAAIVATVTAVWKIVSDVRDRPKLRVSAHYGRTDPLAVAEQGAPDEEYAVVTATNDGRRVVTVLSVGFTLPNGKQIIIQSEKLPLLLGETQTESIPSPLAHVGSQAVVAWARDSRNKVHKSRSRQIGRPK